MRLAFDERLIESHRFDPELAALADRHYSRGKVGSPQFAPPSSPLILRDALGTVLFGWSFQMFRADEFAGQLNCFIFRNESKRISSEIILEAETLAVEKWGPMPAFTYIDPAKIRSTNPGCCFKKAGWKFLRANLDGKHILVKELRAAEEHKR
jgi:hypothetical protein